MKIRYTHTPLPRSFKGSPGSEGILAEGDIIVGSSRLAAKLLIFDNPKSLRMWWVKSVGSDLGKGCLGAVNGLHHEVIHFPAKGEKQRPKYLEVDPRYYCVIGLCKDHLTMEIICHESVHAGFSYAKRIKRSPWDEQAIDMDEELICYPSGKIASCIRDFAYKKGFLK